MANCEKVLSVQQGSVAYNSFVDVPFDQNVLANCEFCDSVCKFNIVLLCKVLAPFVILYSSLCVWFVMSHAALVLLFANILSVFAIDFLASFSASRALRNIITYGVFFLAIAYQHKQINYGDAEKDLMFHVFLSWMHAKCLALSFDLRSTSTNNLHDLFSPKHGLNVRLAYLLYLPSFFFGPLFNFNDFCEKVRNDENLCVL